jgi:hypothetical protein
VNNSSINPIWQSDYFQSKVLIANPSSTCLDGSVNLEGIASGVADRPALQGGVVVGKPSVYVPVPFVRGGDPSFGPRWNVIDGTVLGKPNNPYVSGWKKLGLGALPTSGASFVGDWRVYVHDPSGQWYRVYHPAQAADVVMPQTDPTKNLVGCPVAGLTNARAQAQGYTPTYQAIAPSTAVPVANADGLWDAIAALPPEVAAWYATLGG